jgi:hypothetical protein
LLIQTPDGSWLIGESTTVDSMSSEARPMPYFDEHPNYWVSHPNLTTPGGGEITSVRFTPLADSIEVERAFDIRTACISTAMPCRTMQELMPSADLPYLTWESRGGSCTDKALWRIARDSGRILLARVNRILPSKGETGYLSIQLISVLRGDANNLPVLEKISD